MRKTARMPAGFRRLLPVALLALAAWLPAGCDDERHPPYKEMATAEVKTRLEAGEPLIFLAFETEEQCGYEDVAPVVSFDFPLGAGQQPRLLEFLAAVDGGREQVLIMCPRHREEAKRVYDFLAQEGMDRDRLYILLEGREEWPY